MIYLFENPGQIGEEMLARMLLFLPPQRKEKAVAYRYAIDQKMSALAYLLLGFGLRKEYGIQDPPPFSYGEKGKPRLAAHPAIHFNLTHCKRAVACVISKRVAGIDAECVQPFEMALAEKICKQSELKAILASDRPDIAFTRLWTEKESVMKYTGEGLHDDVREVLTDVKLSRHSWISDSGQGLYALTVAYPAHRKAPVERVYLTLGDLVDYLNHQLPSPPVN